MPSYDSVQYVLYQSGSGGGSAFAPRCEKSCAAATAAAKTRPRLPAPEIRLDKVRRDMRYSFSRRCYPRPMARSRELQASRARGNAN
jgi:hypothetical protein